MSSASLKPIVTSVWAYNGDKITTGISNYITSANKSSSGTYNFYNADINETFKFTPVGDNTFPLYYPPEAGSDEWIVDLDNVTTNTFDSSALSTGLMRGYSTELYDKSIYYDYTFPYLHEPGAVYISTVSVIQTEPVSGDSAYQGASDNGDRQQFLAGNVDTLNGIPSSNDGEPIMNYISKVFPCSTLQGSGTPYETSRDEELDTEEAGWYFNAYFAKFLPDEATYPMPTYTPGIYRNELEVNIGSNGADGTVYRLTPDCKLYINGKQVDCYVSYGTRISTQYYFDVGNVENYTGAIINGVNAPVGGATPAGAENTVCVNSSGTELPIYPSQFTWFVDADNDNVYDIGEEATVKYDSQGNYDPSSTLLSDGAFKYNTVYKLYTQLSLDDSAIGSRMSNTAFSTYLNLDGTNKAMINSYANGNPAGVYTFAQTGAPAGYTVSGTLTSFGSDETAVTTIQLIPSGTSEAAYETTVAGTGAKSYSIANVLPGTYTVKVMKTKHCTREYTVTVDSTAVTQDVKICLLGDVNGDGMVLTDDATEIVKHYNGKASQLSTGDAGNDAYTQKVADVNGDGLVLTDDATEIVKHYNGKASALS